MEAVVQSSPVPMLVIDMDHVVSHWNRALEIVSGVCAADIVGTTQSWRPFYSSARPIMADLIVDGVLNRDVETFYAGKCRRSEVIPDAWEAEDFFPHFPGGGRFLSFTAAPLITPDGRLIGAVETLRDITAERQAQHLMREIIEGCPVPMMVVDSNHVVTHWNRSCSSIIGAPAEDLIGTRDQWKPFYASERPVMADLVVDGNSEQAVEQLYSGKYTRSALIPGAWEAVDYFPNFRNGPRWLYFTAAPLHGLDGSVVGAVETLQDISAQKNYERDLEHQANHDALTGLANRALLSDRLEQALAQAGREKRLLALLFLDLDHFKVINDTLGHAVGDMLVCEIARRVQNATRAGDTVARIGGDEFVVLLYTPESEQVVAEIIERLLRDVLKPVMVGDEVLTVGCSIGAALFPRDGADSATLMMNADAAMYRAKEMGRSTFSFFAPEMNKKVSERLSVERDLRRAVENGEFELHFQPQVGMGSGRIIGAEALLRWNHPTLGMLRPDTFIQLAEDTGLIVPIGQWVMKQAKAEAALWQDISPTQLSMALNLSPRQFRKQGLSKDVADLVEALQGGVVQLELELTESTVMQDPEAAAALMAELKALGVRLSMDDFGTGYSSLAYLRKFPFDLIKIDRSFVAGLGRGQGSEAIVRAVIALAEAFGVGVIAEGVETHAQSYGLVNEGCLLGQGFLFGYPVPAAEFRRRVADQKGLGEPPAWLGEGL